MSGETEAEVSGWTVDTLHQYTIAMMREKDKRDETRFTADERAVTNLKSLLDERFRAQQHAVEELKTATTQRFESVNEFRAQLNDQARLFMGREESISRHERNTETINANALRAESEMKLMRDRFDTELKQLRDRHEQDMAIVNSRLDLTAGSKTGMAEGWGYLVGGLGLVLTIAAVVITLVLAQ